MHFKKVRAAFALLLAMVMLLAAACSSKDPQDGDGSGSQTQSFAQAHDSFQTKLAREENDSDPIPAPPEGVFDLVSYPSKVGDLAAYVSCDPGDGEKHPLIIWVVGGWGNGIDDFPWTYPAWDDDQTGSAFWRAGVLTMYPSFRGGSGNPGYYEALFGEVDDIVSAYEYAASLPYVDPDRIYLGGHSTGGTRALLASEYTDQFRAVFCFGAVDEVKYHNNSQFTFDTSDEMEYTMRSPVHWLADVKSPTFLIEGSEGNADNLRAIQQASKNDQISCYIIDGADHFSVLAPITPLLAQKILADTGAQCNITLTQEELEQAMAGKEEFQLPVMVPYTLEGTGLRFSIPYLWDVEEYAEDGETELAMMSRYEEDNPWDMSAMYVFLYPQGTVTDMQELSDSLQGDGYTMEKITVDGQPAYLGYGIEELSTGNYFNNYFLFMENGDKVIEFSFYLHIDFGDAGNTMFQAILDSMTVE